jgi:hypothetical protein
VLIFLGFSSGRWLSNAQSRRTQLGKQAASAARCGGSIEGTTGERVGLVYMYLESRSLSAKRQVRAKVRPTLFVYGPGSRQCLDLPCSLIYVRCLNSSRRTDQTPAQKARGLSQASTSGARHRATGAIALTLAATHTSWGLGGCTRTLLPSKCCGQIPCVDRSLMAKCLQKLRPNCPGCEVSTSQIPLPMPPNGGA